MLHSLLFVLSWLLAGCAGEPEGDGNAPQHRGPVSLFRGEAQRERLCGRGNQDAVIDVFCRASPPEITGLLELREALGLGEEVAVVDLLDRGFVLNGHSTSLVHRSVSSINPRIIFVRLIPEVDDVTALGFARGERFTEVVVRDRRTRRLQFYLMVFEPACDADDKGCSPGDLLTEATESGWTDLDVYGEEDLVNTPRDCRVCHQPDGPGTRKILRMQELEPPWNHWFYRLSEGGRALLDDYYAAKGDEPLAGIPGKDLAHSQPGLLSFTVFNFSPDQPNKFVSGEIQPEVVASAAEQGGRQPRDNSVPGRSETWAGIYDRAKRGEAISVPYHDVKVTDADKLADMTSAYRDYREGTLARDDLPDIREVFLEEPELRARMGLVTEPGLNGEQVLLQACGQCHNDRLDQSLSRARFNVDIGRLDAEAKRRAIARIQLPVDDPAVMPPALFRRLSDEGRARLIELLER